MKGKRKEPSPGAPGLFGPRPQPARLSKTPGCGVNLTFPTREPASIRGLYRSYRRLRNPLPCRKRKGQKLAPPANRYPPPVRSDARFRNCRSRPKKPSQTPAGLSPCPLLPLGLARAGVCQGQEGRRLKQINKQTNTVCFVWFCFDF